MAKAKKKLAPAPGPLTQGGEDFYKKVGGYLVDNDAIQDVDTIMLYQASVWWEIFIRAATEVQNPEQQIVITAASGHEAISGYISVMGKAETALRTLLTRLGVGEAARQKLKITGVTEHDPMQDL